MIQQREQDDDPVSHNPCGSLANYILDVSYKTEASFCVTQGSNQKKDVCISMRTRGFEPQIMWHQPYAITLRWSILVLLVPTFKRHVRVRIQLLLPQVAMVMFWI